MKKKIVIADDDKEIVTVLTMMLEGAGYEVRSTHNGQTVPMVEKYLPDVLLLDIWMPGTNGRDICKQLKSQPHTKDIPVIMISANRHTEKIALEIGANDYVTKPFDMNDMLEKVARYA